jgi:hypothetical protein
MTALCCVCLLPNGEVTVKRWDDIENDPKTILRIISYIRDNAENLAEYGKNDARKLYSVSGLNIFYDKIWFTGNSNLIKFRLTGKDCNLVIGLWQSSLHFRLDSDINPIPFDKKNYWFEKITIENSENLRRDLTLLRMFGSEELFSG